MIYVWQLIKMEQEIESWMNRILADELKTQNSSRYYTHERVKEMQDIVDQFKAQSNVYVENEYAFFIDALLFELFMLLQANGFEEEKLQDVDIYDRARDIVGFIRTMRRVFQLHRSYCIDKHGDYLSSVYETVPKPITFLFQNNKVDFQD